MGQVYAINAKVSYALALYIKAGKNSVVLKAFEIENKPAGKDDKKRLFSCELKNKSVNN